MSQLKSFISSGKPGVPANITVSALSTTSVQVEWDPGFTGLVGRTFHILYQMLGASTWSQIEVAGTGVGGRQSAEITGLQSDTDYVLRMFASNPAGISATTDSTYFSIQGKVYISGFTMVPGPIFLLFCIMKAHKS